MKRVVWVILALVVVALLGAWGAKSYKLKHVKQQPTSKDIQIAEGIPVETAAAKNEQIEDRLPVFGTIKGKNEVPVYPKVGGRIKEIFVDIGDKVTMGQTLIQLETDEIDDQVRQAEAAYGQASAAVQQADAGISQAQVGIDVSNERLSIVNKGARDQERKQVENMVNQAELGFRNAKLNLDRMQKLLDSGVVPQQQYDAVKLQYDLAQQQLNNAKEQLSLVTEGARAEEKNMALQGVQQANAAKTQAQQMKQQALSAQMQARAGWDYAWKMRENATIKAPVSGVVASRYIDSGTLVGPTMQFPLMTIVDTSSFSMDVDIAETDLDKVTLGQRVEFTVDAVPGQKFMGTVTRINPAATQGTRTYTLKIDISNNGPIHLLTSGQFCRGYIVVKQDSSKLVVSKNALVKYNDSMFKDDAAKKSNSLPVDPKNPGADRWSLFVVKNGISQYREVKLGIINTVDVQVVEGLKPGDSVVVVGAAGLRDGDKVKEKKASK